MNRLATGDDIEGNKPKIFSEMSSDLRVLEALLFAATEPVAPVARIRGWDVYTRNPRGNHPVPAIP